MEAILNTSFSLSCHSLLSLFPSPTTESKSPHVQAHSLICDSQQAVVQRATFDISCAERETPGIPAFDMIEGGARDFLESVHN